MLGSIHSMSYLDTHGFFDRIKAYFKRCQHATIEEQYEKFNVRVFDIHIYFINENFKRAVFKMGDIEFETFSIFEVMNFFDRHDNVYVRMVLEETDLEAHDINYNLAMEARFREYCAMLESVFKNIKFFGGYRECDSHKIYHFNYDHPTDVEFKKDVDKL